MINLDFSNNEHLVRSNVGDPDETYVSAATINSALYVSDDNVVKASILVMETMLSWFATIADESRTGQVEYKYKKLYERYKSRLQDFKSENAASSTIGIIIGGTSLAERNRVETDADSFSPYDLDDWRRLVSRTELDYEEKESSRWY